MSFDYNSFRLIYTDLNSSIIKLNEDSSKEEKDKIISDLHCMLGLLICYNDKTIGDSIRKFTDKIQSSSTASIKDSWTKLSSLISKVEKVHKESFSGSMAVKSGKFSETESKETHASEYVSKPTQSSAMQSKKEIQVDAPFDFSILDEFSSNELESIGKTLEALLDSYQLTQSEESRSMIDPSLQQVVLKDIVSKIYNEIDTIKTIIADSKNQIPNAQFIKGLLDKINLEKNKSITPSQMANLATLATITPSQMANLATLASRLMYPETLVPKPRSLEDVYHKLDDNIQLLLNDQLMKDMRKSSNAPATTQFCTDVIANLEDLEKLTASDNDLNAKIKELEEFVIPNLPNISAIISEGGKVGILRSWALISKDLNIEKKLTESVRKLKDLLNSHQVLARQKEMVMAKETTDALFRLKSEFYRELEKAKGFVHDQNLLKQIDSLITNKKSGSPSFSDKELKVINAILNKIKVPISTESQALPKQVQAPTKQADTIVSKKVKELTTIDFVEALDRLIKSYESEGDKDILTQVSTSTKEILELLRSSIETTKLNDIKILCKNITSTAGKLTPSQLEDIKDLIHKTRLSEAYLPPSEEEVKASEEDVKALNAEDKEETKEQIDDAIIQRIDETALLLQDYQNAGQALNRSIYLKLVLIRDIAGDKKIEDKATALLLKIPLNQTISDSTLKDIYSFLTSLEAQIHETY